MFRGRFSKVYTLLLVFGIFFSICPISYAGTPATGKPNSTQEMYNRDGTVRRIRQFDEKGRAKKGELEAAEKVTTVATLGTIIYYIISEGSRIIFPVRNLIPIL